MPLEHREDKRRNLHSALLEAAREEFGDKGIDAATTRAIAERAGCNEVTLFRQFGSKTGLLVAAVKQSSQQFKEKCSGCGIFEGDLEADLRRYAELYVEGLEATEGMLRAMIGEGKRRPEMFQEMVGDIANDYLGELIEYLDRQKAAGVVRDDVVSTHVAQLFTAMLMTGMLRWKLCFSCMTRATWIEESVQMVKRAVEK